MRIILGVLFLLLLTACAATRQSVEFPSQVNEVPPSEKSRIYVIRSDLQGYAAAASIQSNNQVIGQLGSGGFLSWDAEPGETKLVADFIGLRLPVTLRTKPRTTYFVNLGARYGGLSGIDTFEIISRDEALSRLRRTEPPENVQVKSSWFPYGDSEPWYFTLSFGVSAKTRFSGKIRDVEQSLIRETMSKQDSNQVELMGIYYPVSNSQALVGFQLLGGGWDYYNEEWFDRFTQSLSVIDFLSPRVGRGPFMRGDIGYSTISLVKKDTNVFFAEDKGYKILFGIGYAVPVFKGSSMLVEVNNDTGFYSSGYASTTSLNVGWIW